MTCVCVYFKRELCLYVSVHRDRYGQRYQCKNSGCTARIVIRLDATCEKAMKCVQHNGNGTYTVLYLKMVAVGKI